MTLEEALKIIDPDTCHDALDVYAGDCDMLHAKAVEASKIVVNALRIARKDVAAIAIAHNCLCFVCSNGRGIYGKCIHENEENIPSCSECNRCRCSGCYDFNRFKWWGEP